MMLYSEATDETFSNRSTQMIPDHEHLLVSVDPQIGMDRLMELLKGHCSRLLRQQCPLLIPPLPPRWVNSYVVRW
jgi:putative transposase